MEEIKLSNDLRRAKRPRIQATVPGEFEKVDIRYEVKSNKAKPVNDRENLTYTIMLNQKSKTNKYQV